MIEIKEKRDCCGCEACVQICPKKCISFNEDEQGFRYPLVEESICINCGLCEKVCPVLNQNEVKRPIKVYASINPNEEIRSKSSSGGLFTALAELVIDEGGVVFGAQFDEKWGVEHAYTETKEGLNAFRGSKYVQSRIGNSYVQVREFLKNGRKVLFSGTPCQILGLNLFLRNKYESLITIDIVCHGVPSPLVWMAYLHDIVKFPVGFSEENNFQKEFVNSITNISFRDKSTGWKKYSFKVRGKEFKDGGNPQKEDVLLHELHNKNLFMRIFLKDLCLRPSCANCPAKSGKSGSDITLADYWGIENSYPELDDDKGISMVLIHSDEGQKLFAKSKVNSLETSYSDALRGNPAIENSVNEKLVHIKRFWDIFYAYKFTDIKRYLRILKPNIFQRVVRRLKSVIKRKQ